ncbi:MAG: hypothetical protein PHY14_03300 [Candidatus Gracilibacteria bacterium]|nr:hypothetical protein [Candidatus Gracilibacteria bacterium]
MLDQRLQDLQKVPDRTPQQEAELRGLFAHPDNPRARELLGKEYLTSVGVGMISDDEREELRKIRAAIYASRNKTMGILENNPGDREPVVTINQQNQNGTIDEWYYLATVAKLRSLQEGWGNQDPKSLLDKFINAVELPKTQTMEEAMKAKNDPSDFELFMISKLGNTQFQWSRENKNAGSLGVLESMVCMRDLVRTKKFLQAIAGDITKLDGQIDGEISMCDAGCGSVPILAIYACLCSPKVRCTCLELNQDAIPVARAIVDSFGLSDRINVLQGNAITYQPESGFNYLVSETMHSGLTEEPMAQIFANLSKKVLSTGLILPRNVDVRGDLVSIQEFFASKKVVKVGRNPHHYFERRLPSRFTLNTRKPEEDIEFEVTTPEDGHYLLILTSTVDLGDFQLREYEALITMPQSVQEENGDPKLLHLKKGEKYKVSYKAGSRQRNISIAPLL